MATAYQYEELPKEGYIRILTLYPAAELDAPIFGHLKEAPLGRSSNYCALSYTWGLDKDGCADLSRTINLSGKPLAVTQNLFEGLRRIRDKDASRRLWIDAVCINQSSIAERNAQVAQMAKIYSSASRFVIWLGEGESEDEDEEILTLASLLWEHRPRRPRVSPKPKSCLMQIKDTTVDVYETKVALRILSYGYNEPGDEVPVQQVNKDAKSFRSIGPIVTIATRIFMRRYWRRRWIVQELYQTRRCTDEIRWGPCSFHSLEALHDALGEVIIPADGPLRNTHPDVVAMYNAWVTRANRAMAALSTISRRITSMGPFRWQSEELLLQDFIATLAESSSMQCQDERDRLFSLSSLSPTYTIKADYTMTMAEVCVSFASTLIQEGCLVTVLNLVKSERFEMGRTRQQDLPSWVPDLRATTDMVFPHVEGPWFAKLSPNATVLEIEAHYLGIAELFSTDTDKQSVLCQDKQGKKFRYYLEDCSRYRRHVSTGDIVFLLISKMHESWILVLRKQLQTYHGQNVYEYVSRTVYTNDVRVREVDVGPESTVYIA